MIQFESREATSAANRLAMPNLDSKISTINVIRQIILKCCHGTACTGLYMSPFAGQLCVHVIGLTLRLFFCSLWMGPQFSFRPGHQQGGSVALHDPALDGGLIEV